ncbi:MAG: TonB-dependent receptor [Sphingomonadales bacterium]
MFGKGVVGGAFSIHTARPEEEAGGRIGISYGNFNDIKAYGHVTGALAEGLSGRFSFQVQDRDGFSRDILNQRDLEDKSSGQFRAQLLYEPKGGDFSARLVFDYNQDESNGIHRIGENINPDFAGLKSFSRGRAVVAAARGGLSRRESLSTHPTFVGDTEPTPQQLHRESFALSLNMQKTFAEHFVLESVTGYRDGKSRSLYSQTGIDPRNPYNLADMTVPLVFDSIVYEEEDFKQFSQELNLSYTNPDSRFDWLAGAYYQHTPITKNDIFNAHSQPAAFTNPPIFAQTLSGESRWFNDGTTDTFAVFGQVGFKITEELKLTAGGRYTRDEKDGTAQGLSTATGDFFNPGSTTPLTPLSPTFQLGGGFTTDYGNNWEKFTPQAILEYTPNDDVLVYANVARAFKGGGFEDTPANEVAATSSFDPETVTSFELGSKIDFWDGRARINAAAYYMDYKDLQVTQTSAACLCNITDNAADATIKGIEIETQVAVTEELRIFAAGTYIDSKYKNFVDSLGNDNSGNRLQRTPEYQFNVGFDYTADLMNWTQGLNIYANYSYQGNFRWDPDNITKEPGYGLLDGRISISPSDSVTLSLFGKNILGKRYRVFVINFFADEVAALGAPSTYGGEISVRF